MTRIIAVTILLAVVSTLAQEPPGATASHYSIQHRALNAAGGVSDSSHFQVVSIVDDFGGIASFSTITLQSGFSGQLNDPPVAGPDSISATPGQSVKISISTLLANDTDLENDRLQFVNAPPTSQLGATLATDSISITYGPAPSNVSADTFTYLVTDGINISVGAVMIQISAQEVISISITQTQFAILLRLQGLPGHAYVLQSTTDLTSPVSWVNVTPPAMTPPSGIIEFSDVPSATHTFYRGAQP